MAGTPECWARKKKGDMCILGSLISCHKIIMSKNTERLLAAHKNQRCHLLITNCFLQQVKG